MKPCIVITRISGETYEGIWFNPVLTAEQLSKLGLDEQPGELPVEGEFHIEWDKEIPNPYVDGCFIEASDGKYVAVTEYQVDFEDAAEQIYEAGNHMDWLADKEAAASDYAYDSYYR